MNGKEVLYTMGWDAFGLPTENYAIKVGKSPQEVAKANVKNFKRQVKMFGLSYDWQREINTSESEYYKWTQWIFLELFKSGKAYQKLAKVNWCPKDQTVLANEQIVDGKCERCGAEVVQKEMNQWFFKITDYAERLLSDLKGLDWPEETIKRQEDWVGKSEGAEIEFKINPPLTPSPREGEKETGYGLFRYHTTDPKTWKALQGRVLEMRKQPTDAEEILWQSLRRNLTGFHFRRQHIIGRFIVDFVCFEKSLVVEVDGDIHDFQKGEDEERTKFLKQNGFVVIRFSNAKVLGNVLAVVEEIKKELKSLPFGEGSGGVIKVFTTRPDTLYGATYLVLAPEHKLIQELKPRIKNWGEVENYINSSKKKTELERLKGEKDPTSRKATEGQRKTGIELKGIKAINPATKEEIPVWIADYVLGSYGTGAIMAVPAHDQRDFEFAKKFNLPIRAVIEPITGEERPNEEFRQSVVALVENQKNGKLLSINWGEKLGGNLFVGGGLKDGENPIKCAIREIKEETGYKSLKFISKSEKIHHHYIASSKGGVARNIEAIGLYFKLENEEKTDLKLESDEDGKFKVEWISKKEAQQKVRDELHKYVFEKFILERAYFGRGILANSGNFNGMVSEHAKNKITEFAGGKTKVQYRLRDWSVSRQRYWGVPIPIIYCDKCGVIAVPEKKLPVKLPPLKNYRPKGKPPLAGSEKFMNVKCPKCGGDAERDPETLDTFVDSSWYYLRYADPKNKNEFAKKEKLEYWLPVDLYVIGAEHTTAHLLYARFITKFLHDQGRLNFKEPFLKLRHQGMILGPDGRRMSKRWGNVINPDDVISEYGADTARLYEMFMGPFEQGGPWDNKSIVGIKRFLDRVWGAAHRVEPEEKIHPVRKQEMYHKALKKITEDISAFKFNTAISQLMILMNDLDSEKIYENRFKIFLKLLAPFAPHMTEEIWKGVLNNKTSIHSEIWPKYDVEMLKEKTFELIVQINGKVRDKFEVTKNISQKEAESLTFSREKVKNILGPSQPKKVIFVPNRLINLVV